MADYYTATGNPIAGSSGSSLLVRAEFAAIQAAFDSKLPALAGNAYKIPFVSGGASALTVGSSLYTDANGYLGIGTAAPTAPLNVAWAKARLVATSTTGTNGAYASFANTGGNFYVGLDSSSGSDFAAAYAGAVWHGGAYPLIFGTANVERLRIDGSGNVGIGTAAPGHRLHVIGSGDGRIQVEGAAGFGMVYVQASSGNNAQLQLSSSGGSGRRFNIASLSTGVLAFSDETASTERLRIDSSGNVGVNQTAPNAKLHVYSATANATTINASTGMGDTNFQVWLTNGDTGTASGTIQSKFGLFYNGAGESAVLRFLRGSGAQDGALVIATNATERVRIDGAGYVIDTLQTAAPTLTANNQMTMQLVSNTQLKILVRGSDGTTRSTTLTLA